MTRIFGYSDFPLYDISDDIGYIPRPSQNGFFQRKNDWYFNAMSMPTAREWQPDISPKIFLIGNSIVMGGNPFPQREKLGPLIERGMVSGRIIWPIATGGWTQLNQFAYLKANAEKINSADYVMWEYMSGALNRKTEWKGEYVFPTQRVMCAFCYLFRRYILPRILILNENNELPVSGLITREHVIEFENIINTVFSRNTHRGFIWLYPTAHELTIARSGREWLPERKEIEAVATKEGLRIVDVAKFPQWDTHLYSDGVHPTNEGNEQLAKILATEMMKDGL
ncbi:hypothetical protein [Methylosinus sp. R-45379]|uniref:hypothetical protein n=1 Tax=Methylosinus sp. R-45379 TaxID=980563 RepID=UPI0012EDE7B2|nr:hypothetical protein [Methylosinus sp. R-45379]